MFLNSLALSRFLSLYLHVYIPSRDKCTFITFGLFFSSFQNGLSICLSYCWNCSSCSVFSLLNLTQLPRHLHIFKPYCIYQLSATLHTSFDVYYRVFRCITKPISCEFAILYNSGNVYPVGSSCCGMITTPISILTKWMCILCIVTLAVCFAIQRVDGWYDCYLLSHVLAEMSPMAVLRSPVPIPTSYISEWINVYSGLSWFVFLCFGCSVSNISMQ